MGEWRPSFSPAFVLVNLLILLPVLGLAIIWVVYPLGVLMLAALRGRGIAPSGAGEGRVSVILATSGEAEDVRSRISNLLDTSFPGTHMEVVVGIDAFRARTSVAELSHGLDPRVRIVSGDPPGGKAATLNAAVRAAKHEILVFADTAQSFDRDSIGYLVQALMEPPFGVVSGMLDVPRRRGTMTIADRYWMYERALRRAEARLQSAVGVTGAIYAMRRSLWEPLPAGVILDDVYVPMRLALAGWRIGFAEKARALDERRFTPAQEHRRKVRTLTGIFQLCAWLPDVLVPWKNPLWVQFVCHKLLRLLTPYLVALCALGVLWRLGSFVVSRGFGPGFFIGSAFVVGALLIRRLRQWLAAQISWAYALQSSVVIATINGIRGHWDVWQQ